MSKRIDFQTAKPRQVEAYLREVVRKAHGNTVEDASSVTSNRGYYNVYLKLGTREVAFSNFRKQDAPRIAKAIRALAAA